MQYSRAQCERAEYLLFIVALRVCGRASRLTPAIHSVLRRNFRPLTAISLRVGSMRRQMAAARAMTFTSVVKDSITTSPW